MNLVCADLNVFGWNVLDPKTFMITVKCLCMTNSSNAELGDCISIECQNQRFLMDLRVDFVSGPNQRLCLASVCTGLD